MDVQTIELKKLIASDGMVLTNGEIYGTEIYLGVNDNPNNYHEITKEEYENILASIEQQANEEV